MTQEEIIQDIETQGRRVRNGTIETAVGAGLGILAGHLLFSDIDLSSQVAEYAIRYGSLGTAIYCVSDGLRRVTSGAIQLYRHAMQKNSEE